MGCQTIRRSNPALGSRRRQRVWQALPRRMDWIPPWLLWWPQRLQRPGQCLMPQVKQPLWLHLAQCFDWQQELPPFLQQTLLGWQVPSPGLLEQLRPVRWRALRVEVQSQQVLRLQACSDQLAWQG